MSSDSLTIVDWAYMPELRDKAIFLDEDSACYVIPTSDNCGRLSKNIVYYCWRLLGLEEAEIKDDDNCSGWEVGLRKWNMVDSVGTIVKQIPKQPNNMDMTRVTPTWSVPSFKV